MCALNSNHFYTYILPNSAIALPNPGTLYFPPYTFITLAHYLYFQNQVSDCGYRPTKRPTRVGQVIAKDDCKYTGIRNNSNVECIDYSDDIFHGKDIHISGTQGLKECGRGTQTQGCQLAADAEVLLRVGSSDLLDSQSAQPLPFIIWNPTSSGINYLADKIAANVWRSKGQEHVGNEQGTIAYASHRYHEKVVYMNPNLAGMSQCVSPPNMLHDESGNLVRLNVESVLSTNDDFKQKDDGKRIWTIPAPRSLSDGAPTVWFKDGTGVDADAVLVDNLRLWPKSICSDGGEGSVRVPFHFGSIPVSGAHYATTDTKFFYDFGCPYGSQKGVCPDREGLDQYQKTMDELDQPSGPAFSNCFDVDVPDFECCRAETSLRIHGQEGEVGNRGNEQLAYCAMPEPAHVAEFPNVNAYNLISVYVANLKSNFARTTRIMHLDEDTGNYVSSFYNETLETCMGRCDIMTGPAGIPFKSGETNPSPTISEVVTVNPNINDIRVCQSFDYKPEYGTCTLLAHGQAEYDADREVANGHYEISTASHEELIVGGYRRFLQSGDLYVRPFPATPYVRGAGEKDGDPCPLHWTSYHHTPTGCKDFCAAAFGRIGDDNTCMPGKPECANWLDSDDFPTEYVTVNAECICGAKLEDLQDSGKYVHTGTVLQDTRARARRVLHEDAAKDNDNDRWSWPDSVMAGIDQIHGNHFDAGDACVAEIMSFRTDLLNNSRCDDYLTMGAPPMDEWDPTNTSGHELCAGDGSNDDACCVVHRGEAQASRVWRQMGDMTTSSVDQAFGISSVVGTAVHTSRVAAVGNFVSGAASLEP